MKDEYSHSFSRHDFFRFTTALSSALIIIAVLSAFSRVSASAAGSELERHTTEAIAAGGDSAPASNGSNGLSTKETVKAKEPARPEASSGLSAKEIGKAKEPARPEISTRNSELERHLADAERYFKKAVELDKSNPDSARVYYRMAIMHYEFIVKQGHIRNGRLFYDIGNAYFRAGDIGRAILNYKRAAQYIPNDANLKQNLEYARSMRKDKIEKTQRQKVFKTLFFLHYDLPSNVKLAVFVISFALVWLLALVMLFVRRGAIRVFLVVSAVSAVLFAVSLTVDAVSASRRPQGVIVDDEVIARKGDAETYQPAFKEPLHSGTEFFLLEKRGRWMHIQLDNGSTCWISPGSGELVRIAG